MSLGTSEARSHRLPPAVIVGVLGNHQVADAISTLPDEMALIDSSPRSATVVAATNAAVVPVGEKQFLFLVSRTPHFALNVMRVLAQRLRTANTIVY